MLLFDGQYLKSPGINPFDCFTGMKSERKGVILSNMPETPQSEINGNYIKNNRNCVTFRRMGACNFVFKQFKFT